MKKMNEIKKLQIKIEGATEILTWIKEKLKKTKAEINKECLLFGDNYLYYNATIKGNLDTLVEIKVGMEKHIKKMKHEIEDLTNVK